MASINITKLFPLLRLVLFLFLFSIPPFILTIQDAREALAFYLYGIEGDEGYFV